jgi:cell division protein ZapA
MDGKQKITLNIAGTGHSLNIDGAKEEIYRRAAKEINNKVAALESQFGITDRAKALGIVALGLATRNVELEMSRTLGPEREALAELDRRIEEYLNRL